MRSAFSSKPVEAGMAPAAFDEKSTFHTGDLMGETAGTVGTWSWPPRDVSPPFWTSAISNTIRPNPAAQAKDQTDTDALRRM